MKIRIKRPKGFWATLRWFLTPVPGGAARNTSGHGQSPDRRLESIAVSAPHSKPMDTRSESPGGDCGGDGD